MGPLLISDISGRLAALAIEAVEAGCPITSSITLGGGNDIRQMRFCPDGLTAQAGTKPYEPMTGIWQFIARDAVRQAQLGECVERVRHVHGEFAGCPAEHAAHFENGVGQAVLLEAGQLSSEQITAINPAARMSTGVSLRPGDNIQPDLSWVP